MNRARFIATLGPSSTDLKVISKMVEHGVTSFRLNTAHTEEDSVSRVTSLLRKVEITKGFNPSVILDLKGPEVRLRFRNNDHVDVVEKQQYSIGSEKYKCDFFFNISSIADNLKDGDIILVSDGKIRLRVKSNDGKSVLVIAESSGSIRNNARVNIPGKELDLGVLTERDRLFIRKGIEEVVEFFALSFVQNRKNVEELRKEIREFGGDQYVISKIETHSGVKNIDDICSVSDMIMVARGDLGVELPLEEISITQKRLIARSHSFGIPTIVATQMLESMIESESPTRAEVADISNALLDDADALLLSGETAIGKHPVEAIEYLDRITKYVESGIMEYPEASEFRGNRIAYSVAKAAKILSNDIGKDIVAMTRSGSTVRMLSALRPRGKIYVISQDRRLISRFYLYNNTYPLDLNIKSSKFEGIVDEIIHSNHFRRGELLVVTSGEHYFPFGGTNDVRFVLIGNFIGRGYPLGKGMEGKVTYDPLSDGELLICEKETSEELLSRFQGIIFTFNPLNSVVEQLVWSNKSVLISTSLKRRPSEKEMIYVDPETGIIYN